MSGILRGTKKTGVATGVRNEGAYALGVMESKLKFARRIIDCSASSVTIVDNNEATMILGYDNISKNLYFDSTKVTSSAVAVTVNSDCGNVFSCDPQLSSVTICFNIDNTSASGLASEKGEIFYKSRVVLRNNSL
jgi:hypothetical protein